MNPDEYLSPRFQLKEFLFSQDAIRARHPLRPSNEQIGNLHRLCTTVLQPLAVAVNKPVIITSGYRDAWLNTKVGGAEPSAHMDGRAADIKIPGMRPIEVLRLLRKLGIIYDKAIEEFGAWTHLQISHGVDVPARYMTLQALHRGDDTVYVPLTV